MFPTGKSGWMEIKFLNKFLPGDPLIKELNCSLLKFFGVVLGSTSLSEFFEICDKIVEP